MKKAYAGLDLVHCQPLGQQPTDLHSTASVQQKLPHFSQPEHPAQVPSPAEKTYPSLSFRHHLHTRTPTKSKGMAVRLYIVTVNNVGKLQHVTCMQQHVQATQHVCKARLSHTRSDSTHANRRVSNTACHAEWAPLTVRAGDAIWAVLLPATLCIAGQHLAITGNRRGACSNSRH